MLRRRQVESLLAALLILGCTSGGEGGSGGCGGGCLAPIPGGFPAAERVHSAVGVKLSAAGLRMVEDQVGRLVGEFGGGGAAGLTFDLGCTTGSVPVLGSYFMCDVNGDKRCNAADEDPANRVVSGSNELKCQARANVQSTSMTPQQNADGSVDVVVVVNLVVNTGEIPVSAVGINCIVEFDSDRQVPDALPIEARIRLKLDPARGDILAFDVENVAEISENAIQPNDIRISAGSGWQSAIACTATNLNFVKQFLLDQIQGLIETELRNAIDGFRCQTCDPNNDLCPAGSACNEANGVCYIGIDRKAEPGAEVRSCVPVTPGIEGRVALGDMLAPMGGSPTAALDLSVLVGGRTPAPESKPTMRVQSGGLVLGVMGGTRTPTRDSCVPAIDWPADRPLPRVMDFDAEAARPGPSTGPVSSYQLGLSIADRFLDKAFFDAWAAGVLCLEIDDAVTSFLSTDLFKTFAPSIEVLTHGQSAPMMVRLRAAQPPGVTIGRGTTTIGEDGVPVPEDPLLRLDLKGLNIDFYTQLEERWVRLFSLRADAQLPLGLEFDSAANTVTPVLAGLDSLLTNVKAVNMEMLAEPPEQIESIVASLLGLLEPQLSGILQPFELPEVQGLRLNVLAARGTMPYDPAAPYAEPGHEHLALFTRLVEVPAALGHRTDTRAELVDVVLPDDAAGTPRLLVDVRAEGLRPAGFRGSEFSWRLNGGFWSPWTPRSRLEIGAPVLRLAGRHVVEVRAREQGVAESADLSPAVLVADIDRAAPQVTLVVDDAQRLVAVATDDSTPVDALEYRFTLDGRTPGEWSWQKGLDLAALDGVGSVRAEVRDAAGRIGTAQWDLTQRPAGAAKANAQGDTAGGCAQVGVGALALAGLLALRRRRTR